MFDRDTIGEQGIGCKFYEPLTVVCPENLTLGYNVHILRDGYIDARGGVTIGDNTHIAPQVIIYSWNHDYEGGEALPYGKGRILKPVKIGRNVWIGIRVCICPGVTIGDGAVIGMGSVVGRDVPELAVVGMSDLKILKYRDQEQYLRLDSEKRYGGAGGKPFRI